MKILRTSVPFACFALIQDVSDERVDREPPFNYYFFQTTKNSVVTLHNGPIGLQPFSIYTTVLKKFTARFLNVTVMFEII